MNGTNPHDLKDSKQICAFCGYKFHHVCFQCCDDKHILIVKKLKELEARVKGLEK